MLWESELSVLRRLLTLQPPPSAGRVSICVQQKNIAGKSRKEKQAPRLRKKLNECVKE
jgi:hypothetical protein